MWFSINEPRDIIKSEKLGAALPGIQMRWIINDYYADGSWADSCSAELRSAGLDFVFATAIDRRLPVVMFHYHRKTRDYKVESVFTWYRNARATQVKRPLRVLLRCLQNQTQSVISALRSKRYLKAAKRFRKALQLPVPLVRDIAQVGILAPPNFDDAAINFERDFTLDFYHTRLCASSQQNRVLAKRKLANNPLVGYPHYWKTVSAIKSREAILGRLKTERNDPIIAVLLSNSHSGSSASERANLFSLLAQLASRVIVVVRPQQDIFVECTRLEIEEFEQAVARNGLFMDDSSAFDAGMLIGASTLVVTQSVSAILSAVYLNRLVLRGFMGAMDRDDAKVKAANAVSRGHFRQIPTIQATGDGIRSVEGLFASLQQQRELADRVLRLRREIFGTIDIHRERQNYKTAVASCAALA